MHAAALKQLCNIRASSWCSQYIPHNNGCARCNKIGGYLWKYADKKMKIQKYGILKVLLVYPLTRSTSHQAQEQYTHTICWRFEVWRAFSRILFCCHEITHGRFCSDIKIIFDIIIRFGRKFYFCCSFSFLCSVWRFEHVLNGFSRMKRMWMVLQKLINHAIAIFT